jgi:hypothetical protein
MNEDKTSISQASSYTEAGEYWDSHDLSEVWAQTEAVDIEVDIYSSKSYVSIESELSKELRHLARQRGVSAETLVNLWLQERLGKEQVKSA